MAKMVYYSQAMIKSFVLDIMRQMYQDNFKPEYLVGITRGGLQPALMISHYTGIAMRTLDVRLRDMVGSSREHNASMAEDAQQGRRILVLDDINDTGATFNWICKDWKYPKYNVKYASIVNNLSSEFDNVAYSATEINKAEEDTWIVFPWEEWWGTNYLERSN